MDYNSIPNGRQTAANINSGTTNYRWVFIREKAMSSGISVALSNSTTLADISVIVTKVLNYNAKITFHLSGVKVSNEMNVGSFTDEGIKQITYSVERGYPISTIKTSAIASYFHWGLCKDAEGKEVLEFHTDNNRWSFSLDHPMLQKNFVIQPNVPSTRITTLASNIWPNSSLEDVQDSLANSEKSLRETPLTALSTTSASPTNLVVPFVTSLSNSVVNPSLSSAALMTAKLEPAESARYRLETYITRQYKLYKIEKNGKSYIRTIGAIDKYKQEQMTLLPHTWAMYILKGNIYHLVHVFDKEASYGDITVIFGLTFRVRIAGKVKKVGESEEFDLDRVSGIKPKNHQTMYYIPLAAICKGMCDDEVPFYFPEMRDKAILQVVIEKNLNERLAIKI